MYRIPYVALPFIFYIGCADSPADAPIADDSETSPSSDGASDSSTETGLNRPLISSSRETLMHMKHLTWFVEGVRNF
jgi:hypothetical protein